MLLKKKLDELNVHHLLLNKMKEIGNGDEAQDFILCARIAHVWNFASDPDQTQTYLNWKQNGIVPNYILNWLLE